MNIEFDPETNDGPGIFGLRFTPEEAETVLIPVPWDATASYHPGTARGPEAILAASSQIDLEDLDVGRPDEAGIALLPHPAALAAAGAEARRLAEPVLAALGPGDSPALLQAAEAVNAACASMNDHVHAAAVRWIDRGRLVGVVGGDHSTPFGLIRALAERRPGFGVLQLDAHADLRPAYEGFTWSHASIMHNVLERLPGVSRLVQIGVRDLGRGERQCIEAAPERIRTFYDPALRRRLHAGEPWRRILNEVVDALPDAVYLSFDIDGLDPSLCPHTGTPVPGGLSFPEAVSLLRAVVAGGRRIVGFDLCETAPDPSGATDWDANVAMRLLYKMIGFALRSRTPRRA